MVLSITSKIRDVNKIKIKSYFPSVEYNLTEVILDVFVLCMIYYH